MEEDHRKFEKDLVKLSALVTIVTTGSSIFAAIVVSLLILGISLVQNL